MLPEHVDRSVFTPQGPGIVVDRGPHESKALKIPLVADGRAELIVSGWMGRDGGRIHINLNQPGENALFVQFARSEVVFQQAKAEWQVAPYWTIDRVVTEPPLRLPFDSRLGRPALLSPRYYSTILLPKSLDVTRPFQLVLPPADTWPGGVIRFMPETLNFWRERSW